MADFSCYDPTLLRRPKMRMTTTMKTGTQTMPSTVAVIMPPRTPVPSACWLFALAPLAITSGTTPRMKASDVVSRVHAANPSKTRTEYSLVRHPNGELSLSYKLLAMRLYML